MFLYDFVGSFKWTEEKNKQVISNNIYIIYNNIYKPCDFFCFEKKQRPAPPATHQPKGNFAHTNSHFLASNTLYNPILISSAKNTTLDPLFLTVHF